MRLDIHNLIKAGAEYIEAHPQLLMTILLVLVTPIAFLVSGQQFLSASSINQERLEKDRIGMMHDLFTTLLVETRFDHEIMQREIEVLASLNPDITKFEVAQETDGVLTVVASLDTALVGASSEDDRRYRLANTHPDESMITPHVDNEQGIRYWHSSKLIRSSEYGDHYIFIETSLRHIDDLFAKRIRDAYYWLVGLLAIILFLLYRHVRLIDYAYLYRETKRAVETKDLFTNMIAHELRAPLTAMRGYASMIRERQGLDEETKHNATEIESAAGRLVTIVNDLLDVARIQSGKLAVTSETVHLSALVRSVVGALTVSAHEKQITLSVDDPLGNVTVKGDEKRLYQALTNVVSNSIKYTDRGSITVSITSRSDRVEIRVKDTGMGISAENQQKLFAPFFRVNDEKVSTITGTGLGMWITKQLIDLMGASIGVESIRGVGTHVVITMPK